MSQSTRDNLIVGGVLAAMVLGTSALVYLPQARRLQDLRNRIAQQRARLEEDSQKTAGVPEMARQVEEMKKLYKNFGRRLPQQKELGEFLREISSNLSQEELSNQLIEPGSPQKMELFHSLPIILRFKGSYLSLASFLRRLEKMERLTQVQKLSVSDGGKAGEEDLTIEMRMNIYFTES